MARNYWMLVQTAENFEISKGLGFTLHGVGPKYRKRADRMQPDDRVLYYVSGVNKWTVAATITSKSFEDNAPIWKSYSNRDDFRHRVKIQPTIILQESEYIDAMILAPRLSYVKKWVPDMWPLAFVGSLHLLPQADFKLIEDEMKRLVSYRTKPLWTGPNSKPAESAPTLDVHNSTATATEQASEIAEPVQADEEEQRASA
ncbi:MAG: EVE domain-containing protein [Chloroflexi bacterium]|nr:EVE domain-containing protein [Chloroflexota bacterium]